MAKIIKKIKMKQQDETMSDYIPIGAEASNINVDGESVENKLNKTPYYYNSVADMKADTKLKVGDMAITLGYYSANDGGAAEYKIKSFSDSYYETLNNELIAELIIKEEVNVKQLGAKGNNETDDSSFIQIALNNYNKIFVPSGIYYINNTLLIKSNTDLHGEENSILICHRDLQCINNYSEADVENVHIYNLSFLGNVVEEDVSHYPKRVQNFKDNSYGNGMSTAIYLKGNNSKRKIINYLVKNILIENCKFNDIYSLPIICEGCFNITFKNNKVCNCLDIGFIDNESLNITDNYVTKSADNGFSVSSGNNNVIIDNNIVTYSAFNGLWISGWNVPVTIHGTEGYKMYFGPTNVICTNNIIKYSGYSGIIAKWKVQNILISDNVIDTCYLNVLEGNTDSVDGGCGIKVAGYGGNNIDDQGQIITLTVYSENVTITNNKLSNLKRCGVYLDRVTNFRIHNNSFLNIGSATKKDGTVITATDYTYNTLVYIHNHDTCNADGTIYDNTYCDIRNDKNSINYINNKYVAIKAPYLFILRNYFYDYGDKNIYIENSSKVFNEEYDFSFNTANVFQLDNSLNTVQLIYNKLESLNIGTLPKMVSFPSNITNILSGGNQNVASYGLIRKTTDKIYDYYLAVPYVGKIYSGRINNGSITSKYEFSGTYL